METAAISILLVDAGPPSLDVAKGLEAQGHRLVQAASLAESLAALARDEIALVLADVTAPGACGYDLARHGSTPVICLAAAGACEPADSHRAYGAGAVDFLQMPLDPVVVRAKVAVYAQLHRQQLQLRQAEREQQQIHEAAQHAGRLKDEFLATLSHELRTPLNIILGYAELFQTERLDPEAMAEGLRAIHRNAVVQTNLIDDLLDISRIVSGKLHLTVAVLDLAKIVRAAVDSIALSANARGIQVDVEIAPDAAWVAGDAARLQQAAWNLLVNAVKFTPPGGRIRVELSRSHNRVELIVRDTGEGIDQDFLPYVFDRFRQENSSRTRHHGGLGLGLSIVRYLVELHGGWVHADSKGKGHGSTFHVVLPAAPEVAGTAAGFADEDVRLGPARGALTGLRVLLVDDQPDVRTRGSALLRKAGAAVAVAGGVSEALTVFRKFRPDVLLSETSLPEGSGYDLIRQIRALPAEAGGNVPAAALTTPVRGQERRDAVGAGFQLHLPKPVRAHELIAAVQLLQHQASIGEPSRRRP